MLPGVEPMIYQVVPTSYSNQLFQSDLHFLVQAVQVKGASAWVPNVPTAILHFFFCGGLVGGWLRTPCMGHYSQNAKVHCSCYCPDLVPRGDGKLEAKLDERVGGVSLGDLLQGFNGFSVSYRNLPPYFSVNLGALGHPLLSLFSVKYGDLHIFPYEQPM